MSKRYTNGHQTFEGEEYSTVMAHTDQTTQLLWLQYNSCDSKQYSDCCHEAGRDL